MTALQGWNTTRRAPQCPRPTLNCQSADWGIMLRSLTIIWGIGAAFFPVVLVSSRPSAGARIVLVSIDAIAFAVLGLLLLGGERLPPWTLDVCAYLLYVVVGGMVFAFQDPASPLAFLYLWLSVHSFYFLPWRRAAPQIGFIALDYGLSLWAMPHSAFPYLRWAVTVLTAAVICTLVALLRSRVDTLMARLGAVARTDVLTELHNRRGYDEFVEIELSRADRSHRPLALIIGDVDHFKLVNDSFGHPTGDAVLRRLADRMIETRRRTDVIARVGGEEFALLLPETDAHGARVVAERLRADIAATFADWPIPVTMSFGVACYPDDGADGVSLFQAADHALLAAKTAGRDRTVVYSAALTPADPIPQV